MRLRGGLARGLLAHGSLTEPGRSSALEITCPGPEAALALVGSGPPSADPGEGPRGPRRRPGGDPRRRRHRGDAHPHGCPRGGAGVGGAPDAARGPRHSQPAGQLRRRQPASVGARRGCRRRSVERALELLGDEIPDHLREAGELRIMHKQASLEELGQLATLPMTKTPWPAASGGFSPWPTSTPPTSVSRAPRPTPPRDDRRLNCLLGIPAGASYVTVHRDLQPARAKADPVGWRWQVSRH